MAQRSIAFRMKNTSNPCKEKLNVIEPVYILQPPSSIYTHYCEYNVYELYEILRERKKCPWGKTCHYSIIGRTSVLRNVGLCRHLLVTTRGRKCYTKDGVLMITCSGVLVITVTEFVGKNLYILQKHFVKWLFSSFQNEF
jgi:hypothetical protein